MEILYKIFETLLKIYAYNLIIIEIDLVKKSLILHLIFPIFIILYKKK